MADALPKDCRVAWVSTRRAFPAADTVAGNVHSRLLLADLLANKEAPLHELSGAHLTVLEVPPVTKPLFEHQLLDLVQRVQKVSEETLLLVQPSLRRKTNKALWVTKWNQMTQIPFKFIQICSCKVGDNSGCHLTCYLAGSRVPNIEACQEVPTRATCSQASIESLGAVLRHLAVSMLSQQTPNSALAPESIDSAIARAYPTDAKEREKARRKNEKERGIEHAVQKRKKIVEDHHDDCGDDMSSLNDRDTNISSLPCSRVISTRMMHCPMRTMTRACRCSLAL